MIAYNDKLFGIADNLQFKRINDRNKPPQYILFNDQKVYSIKGVSARLLERVVHFKSFDLSEIGPQKAIAENFSDFLETGWIQEINENRPVRLTLANHTYKHLAGGKGYIVNFLYKTADRLTGQTYDLLLNKQFDRIPDDELFYLYSRKYIQAEQADNEIILSNENNDKIVYLIFSYDCNLKCTYCFERDKNRKLQMNADTLAESIKYIESLAAGNMVYLVFYGGEPLLAENKENVIAVMEKLRKNRNVFFRFITNGVNIAEYIESFNPMKDRISRFVITLDGTREIHDNRRISTDLNGSFDSVIDSIKLLNRNGYPVTIRININNENVGCQEALIRYLNKTIKKKNTVSIEYNRVENRADLNYTPTPYIDCYKIFTGVKKVSKFVVNFNLPIINLLNGIKNKNNDAPKIIRPYCIADSKFVIDYDGQIYSCNEAMGNEDFKVGNVGRMPQSKCLPDAMDDGCKTCAFYVSCYGRCYLEKYYFAKQVNDKKCDYNMVKEVVDYFLASELK